MSPCAASTLQRQSRPPHQLVRKVIDQGKHHRVRGRHHEFGASHRQPQKNAGRQNEEQDSEKDAHEDIHIYSGPLFSA